MSDAPRPPAVHHDPDTAQQAVLVALRRIGPTSPDTLAAELGTTRSAALARLRTLEAAGLVSRDVVRHGVGRPRHRYDLTAAAQALLPSNYAGLATGLLDALELMGDAPTVQAVFAERRRRQADGIRTRFAERGLSRAPLEDRVRELAIIQDEQGYLCDCALQGSSPAGDGLVCTRGDDGALRMRQANCAIYEVASAHPEACAAELELYTEVLGTDVVREAHIVSGDRTCTYRIGPPGTA